MSRPKREWYPGATYHVMSRGNRRLALFKDEADYLLFLEGIMRVKKKHRKSSNMSTIDRTSPAFLQGSRI